jgi:gluconolactonase
MLKISLCRSLPLLGLGCIQALSGCSSAGEGTPQGGAGSSPNAGQPTAAGTGSAGAAGMAGQGTGGVGGTPAGVAGQAGSPPGAGAGGAAGGGASGVGGSGSVNPGKGASGKAVCTGLSGFVDPTTGMGTVKEVTAPQGSFFAFIEGTVWVATTQQLLFSDNAGSPERIWSFDPTNMMLTNVLEDSGSNGLAVDSNDQIVVADQKNRAIYRWDSATKMKVGGNIASGTFKPNDVVVRSDGGIYITDPQSGLYYIAPGSSEVKKASTKVSGPNGIVLTLDEKALIVGDVNNQSLSKFELGADGSVIDMTTPFGMTMGTTADGMCEDCAGNVYVGTQTGVEIFDSTGKRLGVVPTGESSNCTFGGADRKTLFVASRATLKVVTMANAGLPD